MSSERPPTGAEQAFVDAWERLTGNTEERRRGLALAIHDALRWTRDSEVQEGGWDVLGEGLKLAAVPDEIAEDTERDWYGRLLAAGWNLGPPSDERRFALSFVHQRAGDGEGPLAELSGYSDGNSYEKDLALRAFHAGSMHAIPTLSAQRAGEPPTPDEGETCDECGRTGVLEPTNSPDDGTPLCPTCAVAWAISEPPPYSVTERLQGALEKIVAWDEAEKPHKNLPLEDCARVARAALDVARRDATA